MLNQILDVSINTLILDIFIILGVVIAGSLIFYFIWEGITALSKKKESKSDAENVVEMEKTTDNVAVEDYHLQDAVATKEDAVEEDKTAENKEELEVISDEEVEEESEPENSESEEEDEIMARREFLEQRRQELIRRMQESLENDSEKEEPEETDEDESVEENVEPSEENEVEEVAAEEKEETEQIETVEENREDKSDLEEEKAELLAEKDKYAQMCKELEVAKQALLDSMQNQVPTSPISYNVEQLKAELEELEAKIKISDKEFKQCKKDFLPLDKVWKKYESYVKKLNRREALVARQKVMLYGVNNYAEIDEERAKKLAEDLDLLDGLKLSVQHCEEVMTKNEERYPLLQKMYEVLKNQNEELKARAKLIKEAIAKLTSESGESENSESESVEERENVEENITTEVQKEENSDNASNDVQTVMPNENNEEGDK